MTRRGGSYAPDLVVNTPTVSESAPTAGSRITLNATVRNQGNGRSDSTTLRYYQSTDSTITTGDTAVGTDSVFRLDAAESGDEWISVNAPSTPGTYYYGACVDAVSGETDTTNNCSSSVTVVVGAAPAPDLIVNTPTFSDSAPTAGARITLNATVRNQGNGAADSTTLRYYQSTDSTISTSDTEVGTDSVFGLSASRTGNESASLTAPSTPGTYYYGACVDAVTGESDTTNNCSTVVTVTVGAAPAPDLVVDALTVSNSAPAAGASITLSASVRNQGSGDANSTTLRYLRSIDSTITTGDTEVGTDSVFRLDAAESGNESASLTAPSTPGTYYYGACVDAVTSESDTTNNCSIAVVVTVGVAPLPDLVMDNPTASPSSPTTGSSFTLNATARNQGSAAAGATTLRYYRSTDMTITTADTEVGSDSVSSLNASGSSAESVSLTAPSTAGTYYYGACVDKVTSESDTTNNCSAAVTVTVGAAPAPDLVVDTPTASPSGPTTGSSFTLNATARNQGSAAAGATTLRYYRSTDMTITTADTEVGSDSVSSLNASGSSAESASLAVPSTAGTYYYGACVDAVTGESNTTNNCSTAVAVAVGAVSAPDLVVDMGGGTGTSVAGTKFDIQLAVRNQGSAATSDSTTLRYYRSTDAVITNADTEVGTDSVGSVAGSNGISRHSIDLTAPSTKGTYYYGACVDAAAGETNTTNNCSSPRTIAITALGPDLVVTQVNVPVNSLGASTADPFEGEDFWISIHVKNQGDSRALSPTVRFYRSADTTISTSDTEIGTLGLLHMAASRHFDGGSIKTLTTAPTAAGTYYYGACVDFAEGESDKTNNCSSAEAVTVVSASGSDLIVQSFRIQAIEVYFPTLPLYATVRNRGTGTSASTPVGFYLSADSNISTSDTRIDGQYVKRLAPSETGRAQVTTSAENAPGTYYYGACVLAVSGETDTTNNCSSAVEVTVGDDDTASVPGKPAGLTATVDGQTEIDLSWTAPSSDGGASITGYKIEVSTDNSSWSDLVANTGSAATSYSHTGLMASSTRHYRVSAINSAGTGTASNVANATTDSPQAATAPGAPTGLTATADGQTGIDLSWTAPSDDGGATITGYRIEVSTDGSSWDDLVADSDFTSTSYSHTGLTTGSTRHYRVSAINSVGTGPASNTDSATTDGEAVSDGTCTVNLIVEPGESCTYPGTSAEFSVDSSGSGSFLFTRAGSKIELRNSTINGVTYTFVASKQSSGNWLVEEVG